MPVDIFGNGTLGSFHGTFDYTSEDDTTGSVVVSLTNTSSTPGFLTGFVFNIPYHLESPPTVTDASLSASDPDFLLLGGPGFWSSEGGSPYGLFDIGAALGGDWEGGGNPTHGLAVGVTGTFTLTLTGTNLASLTSESFLGTLSEGPGQGQGAESFVVRFRGFDEGGSDKVPAQTVPEPGTIALVGLGVSALVARRRRSFRS